MKFDLKDLDTAKFAQDGAELQLVHPDGVTPMDMFITLRGMDSQIFESTQLEQRRRLQARRIRNAKYVVPAEEEAEFGYELLAACTVSWRGFEENGQPLVCSEATALAQYRKYQWLRDQVAAFVQDRANFLPRRSTSSSSSPATSSS